MINEFETGGRGAEHAEAAGNGQLAGNALDLEQIHPGVAGEGQPMMVGRPGEVAFGGGMAVEKEGRGTVGGNGHGQGRGVIELGGVKLVHKNGGLFGVQVNHAVARAEDGEAAGGKRLGGRDAGPEQDGDNKSSFVHVILQATAAARDSCAEARHEN